MSANTIHHLHGRSTLARTTLFVVIGLCHGSVVLGQSDLYFPPSEGVWEHVDPSDAGMDPHKLQSAVDYAEDCRSSALIILWRGWIASENYWKIERGSKHSTPRYQRMVVGATTAGHPVEDVASVQKSVVSFLLGIAVGEGKLKLDDPVQKHLGTGWSQAKPEQEQLITVRHLITMTSGLNDSLRYQSPPGKVWRYNTGAYGRVVPILEAVWEQPIAEITKTKLTARIGMADTRWRPRPWAARIAASAKIGLATTARDLARFGLLIRTGGRWDGKDILASPGYLSAALSPSQSLNKSYGYLWWLNGQESSLRPGRRQAEEGSLIQPAPNDMVAAMGALGRKVYVVPSCELVVVRMGNAPGVEFDFEFWEMLSDALSVGTR